MNDQHTRTSALAALAGCTLVLSAAVAEAAPTRVLHNGKVFTARPDAPWAQAVAIDGDRIAAVGGDAEVLALAGAGTAVVDLGGRTVVPGLNDAHVHALSAAGAYLNVPDFVPGPGPTLDEVLDLVAAGAASTPPGTWLIVAVGSNVIEDPDSNRFSLDTVSPDHPVKLEVWTGHGTYLNSRALESLGFAEDEPDPLGGSWTRVPGTSIVTGEAHEYAEHWIRRRMYAAMSDAEIAARYQAFAGQALSLGFTSAQDMAVGLTKARSMKILKTADLPLRLRSICFPLTPDENCNAGGHSHGSKKQLTSSGIKWIADGTPIERLAFVGEPYADRPGWSGQFNLPDGPLAEILANGLSGNARERQLLFHAVGDGAIDQVFDAMEATGGALAWHDRRTRIEHGDLLFPASFGRAKALGAVIVQNATHLALASVFAERFTPATFASVQPLRSLLDAGIPLALGTDGIGRAQSPWVDVFLAAIHPTRPSEAITVEEAIAAYTRGSAYAEFEEDRKGTLAPGMLADLAVLSQDVFTVPIFAVPGTFSLLTMVNGEIAWDTGAL